MQAGGLLSTRFHALVLRSGMTLAGAEGLTHTAVARHFSWFKASVRDEPGKIGFLSKRGTGWLQVSLAPPPVRPKSSLQR